MEKDKRIMEASCWKRLMEGELYVYVYIYKMYIYIFISGEGNGNPL